MTTAMRRAIDLLILGFGMALGGLMFLVCVLGILRA